jgi:hypothetical protein
MAHAGGLKRPIFLSKKLGLGGQYMKKTISIFSLVHASKKVVAISVALIGLLVFAHAAMAQDPVYFADANLKAAVERELGISNPTPTDMLLLTSLSAGNWGIVDLTGIEYATNLTYLDLRWNQISNISALSGLINLTELLLHDNQISDISALSGLTNLEKLYFCCNPISDITALSGLTNLTFLVLMENQISDISALSGLTNLTYLTLRNNQISDISALSGLINLTELWLYQNQISNISALSGLTNLTYLSLHNNQISDISALSEMTQLRLLLLSSNPLNLEAYCNYLPLIGENNPDISLWIDPCSYGDCDEDGIPDICDVDLIDNDGDGKDDGVGEGHGCDNCRTLANPDQADIYPPQGNGIGDACDCEGNFACDLDVDGTDASIFKLYFGRSTFNNPCTAFDPCRGDFNCDGDADGSDASLFKADFGRSGASNPCPACVVGDWCTY